jgi:hypothetical protein
MKKAKLIIFASVALVLIGYAAWTTACLASLQSRLAGLESSHRALGRYTYDLAVASLRTNTTREFAWTRSTSALLNEMRQDDLLQPAVYSGRGARVINLGGSQSRKPRNLVERITQ